MTDIYFAWITVLLSSCQDDIIAGLVKKGYMVGPTSKDGKVVSAPGENPAGSVIAISVYRQAGTIDAKQVYDDIVFILNESQGYFYSVIVALASEASWVGSNFELPVKKQPATPPPIPTPPPNKNLN